MRPFTRGPPCPLWARVAGSNRHGAVGVRARSGQGGDPGPRLFSFGRVKDADFARDQKADRLDRQSDPGDVGDDRDPLATGRMLKAEIEIIPPRPRKPRSELVVKPDLVTPPERFGDRRGQDLMAFLPGYPALDRDADNIARQVFEQLDHGCSPDDLCI